VLRKTTPKWRHNWCIDNTVEISFLFRRETRVKLVAGLFDAEESATLNVEQGRRIYVHVARGRLTANDVQLDAGDALQLTDATSLSLTKGAGAEVLVFDLPG